MGANRFFWPQSILDQWIDEEKISLKDDVMTILSQSRAFRVKQAVFFERDVGGGQDSHSFVGRVKELETLLKMGAEHYMDSVIIDDSAYQVVPGFTGEPLMQDEERPHDLSGALTSQIADGESEENDKELLARFLLENL